MFINVFIHLFLLQIVTEPLLSARHCVWYQKKTQEPYSSGTYSQVEEAIASGKSTNSSHPHSLSGLLFIHEKLNAQRMQALSQALAYNSV